MSRAQIKGNTKHQKTEVLLPQAGPEMCCPASSGLGTKIGFWLQSRP